MVVLLREQGPPSRFQQLTLESAHFVDLNYHATCDDRARTAQEVAQQGMMALLYFDGTGRIGFHIRDFDANEINVIAGANSITLAQAIFNALSANANKQTMHIIEQQHRAIEAKKIACGVLFASAL